MKRLFFVVLMVCVGCAKAPKEVVKEEPVKERINRQVTIDGVTHTVTEGSANEAYEQLLKPPSAKSVTKMPNTKMPTGEPIRKPSDAVKIGKTT